MKFAHLIKLSVFSHGYENSEAIKNALVKLIPFILSENRILIKISGAEGLNGNKIQIFEVVLSKASLIKKFLDSLIGRLDKGQKKLIIAQAESRLDSNFDFFLRFDKDALIKSNELELTDSGKCFHIKIGIAAFPKKRGVALNIARELFSK